jgi:plastocyanin
MRVPAIVASAALLLAACGGEKKAVTTDTTTMAPPAAPPAATTATGATHEVQMISDGANSFKFVPAELTIKAGDAVTFKSVSGLSHDIAFYKDSIPPGAEAVLNANIQNKPQDLATEMVPEGSSTTVSFAGAPAGTYKYYCIPHMAMNMKGTITVTP